MLKKYKNISLRLSQSLAMTYPIYKHPNFAHNTTRLVNAIDILGDENFFNGDLC